MADKPATTYQTMLIAFLVVAVIFMLIHLDMKVAQLSEKLDRIESYSRH